MDCGRHIALTFFGILAASCGSDESHPAAPGAGGTSSASLELCTKACAVLPTCDESADLAACEAQCAKELAGAGYLDPGIAKEYFQLFVTKGTDPSCEYSKGDMAWWYWTKDGDRIDTLPEQAVMTECRDVWSGCIGPTGTQDGFRSKCFREYYRYGKTLRGQVKACFSLKCSMTEPFDCVSNAQPKGAPWLAGIEKPAFQ